MVCRCNSALDFGGLDRAVSRAGKELLGVGRRKSAMSLSRAMATTPASEEIG